MKLIRLFILLMSLGLASSHANAQLGGFLNSVKDQLNQVQKDLEQNQKTTPAGVNQNSQSSSAPNANTSLPKPSLKDQASSANGVRDKWLRDPYPDIPKEVSDEDIQRLSNASLQKIYIALASPQLNKGYSGCKEKEEARLNKTISQYKKNAADARTVSDRDAALKQANDIEKIKTSINSTTCLFRVVRRATLELGLENYGVQPKYGARLGPDEQFNVVQVYKVSKAFETKQFLDKFYSDMSTELNYNYEEWIERYLKKPSKDAVEELKKQTNSSRDKAQMDAGYELGINRRLQFYNEVISSIVRMILSEQVKPS